MGSGRIVAIVFVFFFFFFFFFWGGGYTEAQILIVSLSFKVYSSFAFWTTFAIIHIFGCLYLSSQIYYMGRVKFGEFWIVNVEVYLVILGIVLVRICLIYDSMEGILL